jgi:hypothetical protein
VKTPKNDKHKEYAHYAEHCLQMVPKIPDQEYRAIRREMAAEWIKLADERVRRVATSPRHLLWRLRQCNYFS